MDREIMKGSIDILLLNLLNGKDMYGYEMVKVLKEKSEQLYSMGEGTLYPGLKRMEKKGGSIRIGTKQIMDAGNIIGLRKMGKMYWERN